MPHHGMRKDYDFEDYALKIYMKGKPVYGSYWEHVNVSILIHINLDILGIFLNSSLTKDVEN